MKHIMLKFNHGVELGAFLAYKGHFKRTAEASVHSIMLEELEHRDTIRSILLSLKDKPFPPFDAFFFVVGHIIMALCRVAPIWSLDLVARIMEAFAVFNHSKLAKVYPEHSTTFINMVNAELRHQYYFTEKKNHDNFFKHLARSRK